MSFNISHYSKIYIFITIFWIISDLMPLKKQNIYILCIINFQLEVKI